MPLPFVTCGFAVRNGMTGADMIASETENAVLSPLGLVVSFQTDIFHWTHGNAFSTAYAFIGARERFWRCKEFHE